ncbi:MAG: hypothetical protein AAB822_01375 [Patescibacteria group bacterium]
MEDEIDFFDEDDDGELVEKEEKKELPPAGAELLFEKALEDDFELNEELERLPI